MFEGPFEVDLTAEQIIRAEALVSQAEQDIDEAQARVTIRWDRDALDIIRRAARAYGLPYQTYLKQAALRQAISDLASIQSVTSSESAKSSASTETIRR